MYLIQYDLFDGLNIGFQFLFLNLKTTARGDGYLLLTIFSFSNQSYSKTCKEPANYFSGGYCPKIFATASSIACCLSCGVPFS